MIQEVTAARGGEHIRLPERTIGASIRPSLKSDVGRIHRTISASSKRGRLAGGCRDVGGDDESVRIDMARRRKRMSQS